MKAIYRGVLATITECQGNPHAPTPAEDLARVYPGERPAILQAIAGLWDLDGVILDHEVWVSHMDPALIVDPTDAQVAAAR